MFINGRPIGEEYLPYVVAEMSANHNGSLDRGLAIIEAARKAGADAIKLQTYTADTMTIKHKGPDFQLTDGPWAGRSLYELYESAYTPWEWHGALFAKGKELGITVFSTPFDQSAVDFLDQFDPPAYKIASFELVDTPLIEYIASRGKPMIMSTGMANNNEIKEAVATARESGCTDLCLLHCISGYPAAAQEINLRAILDLKRLYGVVAGLSDHTLGTPVSVAAVALGASVIEKHLTLRRSDGGPDSGFSLEPEELEKLVHDVQTAYQAIGCTSVLGKTSELPQRSLRRSLYATKNIVSGETFSSDNIRIIRPGYGLHPRHRDSFIGRKAARDIFAGERVTWSMLDGAGDDKKTREDSSDN